MNLRVKKLPILIPLLLVAVVLTATAVSARLGRDSAAAHTDLGQKYLNDMNYTGAIAEFLQSLSMDPTGQEARLGLAQAYVASGSPEMAPEILEPLTEANSADAYRILIDSQRDSDPIRALIAAQELVDHTDQEEDYAVRDELLTQALSEARSYAAGVDQRLVLQGGELLSAGSNTFGQLGTGQGLSTETVQEGLQSAQFSGQAVRVYCAGRTSYVVDQSGNLWAAGANRWGQMGVDYAAADPQSGWTQIVDTGDVAAVAGGVGTLYVLKTDGTLWYAGQGGVLELRPVSQLGTVIAVESSQQQTAALTAEGSLYLNDGSSASGWTRQAQNVRRFCFSGSGLIWVTQENQLGAWNASLPAPDGWTQDSQGTVPDFQVRDLASDGNGLLLLDSDGRLLRVYNNQVYETEGADVVNLYSSSASAVVERQDGSVQLWDLSLPTPGAVS